MPTSLKRSSFKINLETSLGEINREFSTKCMVTNQSQYSNPRISNITTDSRLAGGNSLFLPSKETNLMVTILLNKQSVKMQQVLLLI